MPLRLRVLGAPLLQRVVGEGEQEVHVQAKRLAILAFLAVRRPPGWCRRDTLLSLFWSERDGHDARNGLNQAVHQLRLGLGNRVISTRGHEEIRVEPGRLWCDALAFQDALAGGRCEDALDLYRGPFLDGLHVGDAPEFDGWLRAERERLRAQAAEAASLLAHQERARGRTAVCVRWLQRLLALSPDDESALRQLMAVRRVLGDRPGALRDYQDFVRRLSRELDLEHADGTRFLADAIRSEAGVPVPAVPRDQPADDAYWRGLVHWSRRTPDDLRQSLYWFRQAMERNPSSCEAHAAFAMAGTALAAAFYDAEPADVLFPLVRSALTRALAIDGGHASALAVLALVQGLYERRWREAEATSARACGLASHNTIVHHTRAVLAAYTGRLDDALVSIEQAARLEPLALGYREIPGHYLCAARRYRQAAGDMEGLLRLEPRLYLARMALGHARAALGDTKAAEKAYRETLTAAGRHPYPLTSLAVLLARTGRARRAARLLDELLHLASSRYVRPTYLAVVHAALGDHDSAFAALERAIAERDIHATSIVADPFADALREDPRFPPIVRRLGLEPRRLPGVGFSGSVEG